MRHIYTEVLVLAVLCFVLPSCKQHSEAADDDTWYTNPISTEFSNTSFYYDNGMYYYVLNSYGNLLVQGMKDPTEVSLSAMKVACEMKKVHGLEHMWHPQITRIDGKWYIYVTADDGNTDNHKMYVLENDNENPLEGKFELKSRLVTDKDDNWAMHGHVFEHNGKLYMTWSGWASRRAYVETQCIYIARMIDPLTLSGERVMISKPEYEWELQWVQRDGQSSIRYPVFVNEHPTFFCCDKTDKAYIYYSASGSWTAFACIGELSADKDADLLDPASWKKSAEPVFSENREEHIFGPSVPCFIPSPDGEDWFLCYGATETEKINSRGDLFIQKISFSPEGHPELGVPVSRTEKLRKVTCQPRHQ